MVHTISVLYVDDEASLLEIGKRYLERTTEFSVTTATSDSAALDLPVNQHKIIQCNIRDITERKRAETALALAGRKLNLMSTRPCPAF